MATLSQLQTAADNTAAEIVKQEDKVKALNLSAARAVTSAQGQMAWASTKSCRKRDNACQMQVSKAMLDAKKGFADAKTYKASAKKINDETLPGLRKTLNEQNAAIANFNQSEIDISNELSKQGETRDSVKTKADYEGKANYDASMLAAQTEASEKKNLNYLYIGAGVLVIAIVAYVAYKKLSK